MESILDEVLYEQRTRKVKYAGFWPRLGATILDVIAVLPVVLGLAWFNVVSLKSPALFMLGTLVTTAYKPVMEALYGATFGKMALDIKVVKSDLRRVDVRSVIFRNVFHIVPSIVSALLTLGVFYMPEMENVKSYPEFLALVALAGGADMVNNVSGLIYVVDGIAMMADDRSRSIHDRIAGTCVIVVDKSRPE